MQLKAFQKQFSYVPGGPKTAKASLEGLMSCCKRALDLMDQGTNPTTQALLEQALTYLMLSYHYTNLDLEKVAEREMTRWKSQEDPKSRLIMVFKDYAELRVDGELRGTIPLYTPEDYRELKEIAHLFGCRIEASDHVQLGLFDLMKAINAEVDAAQQQAAQQAAS